MRGCGPHAELIDSWFIAPKSRVLSLSERFFQGKAIGNRAKSYVVTLMRELSPVGLGIDRPRVVNAIYSQIKPALLCGRHLVRALTLGSYFIKEEANIVSKTIQSKIMEVLN